VHTVDYKSRNLTSFQRAFGWLGIACLIIADPNRFAVPTKLSSLKLGTLVQQWTY
jgi:hypothetical protein